MTAGTNNKLNRFCTRFKKVNYKKGDIVIRGDDEPSGVYFLSKGFVKMSSIFEDGTELSFNIFKPGSFFPMTWAIGNIPNNYYYQTISTTTLYRIPKENFTDFIKENSDVLYDLASRVLVGTDGMVTAFKHILKGNSTAKVVSILLVLAKRFGILLKNGHTLIELDLTHQDIANFAGISRETVSLAIEKLRRMNILTSSKRRLVIQNLNDLEKQFLI